MSDQASQQSQENKGRSAAEDISQRKGPGGATGFKDNRPEVESNREIRNMVNASPRVKQMKALQSMVNSSRSNTVQFAKGNLVNFRTVSMGTSASVLNHQFAWDSSTGNLADIAHIKTRENVKWGKPPAEFGGTGAYADAGQHNGLAEANAQAGGGADNHDIIPAQGFAGKNAYKLDGDGTSAVWTLDQVYEMSVDGGDWAPIPGTRYQLTRWFERKGEDLIAYMSKRGVDEGTMHRAMFFYKGWYK